jgi:hypothetical protein
MSPLQIPYFEIESHNTNFWIDLSRVDQTEMAFRRRGLAPSRRARCTTPPRDRRCTPLCRGRLDRRATKSHDGNSSHLAAHKPVPSSCPYRPALTNTASPPRVSSRLSISFVAKRCIPSSTPLPVKAHLSSMCKRAHPLPAVIATATETHYLLLAPATAQHPLGPSKASPPCLCPALTRPSPESTPQ